MLLRTLGGLSLPDARFKRPKPLLMLAYLALEGPQDRRYLAELFWPNAADPRQSLSVALSQLHGAHPSLVHSDRSCVRTGVECDAVQLREAASNHEWQRVVELYQGGFLVGVDAGPGNVELEEWLYDRRELLALTAQTALLELGDRSLARGDVPAASRLAERAAALAPTAGGEAPRMERLHALLAATDSPRLGALRKEAESLGIHLPARPAQRRHEAGHSLPRDLTLFVGREQELETIITLITEGVRLVTVTGLGGIGKSRLALELGRRLARTGRYEQIHFVPLGGAPADDQFASLLAAMLSRPNRGRRSTDKPGAAEGPAASLLLLDDFAPTPSSREQIESLLAGMPLLDVIVTAREPLGSLAETQYQLSGLALSKPSLDADTPSDALALYLQTARRFYPSFQPDPVSMRSICELVAGSPLGIELAASLSRVLPTPELLSELRLSLDVLTGGPGVMPERHHSVRAIFDSSWARLTDAERAALAGCGVFEGGFSRGAAADVLGVDVQLLGALLERSLLRRRGSRFELHPLVQQYAREMLDAFPEAEAWRERHAVHFTAWFASKRLFDQRSGQRQALEELEADFPNLQAAWQWAADAARTDLLEQAIFMTSRFLHLRGRTSELMRLLHVADAVAAEDSLLHARVLRWRAALMGWEDPAGAQQLLGEALAIHGALGRQDDLGTLYHQLGLVSAFQGDVEMARRHWRTAIPLLEKRDDEELLGAACSSLSLVTELAEEHEALARRAHAICVERGATAQLAVCLANEAGEAHYAYGDSTLAVARLEAAIAIEESEGGREDYLERFYHRQAYEYVNLGDLSRAEERLKQAYRLITERGTGSFPDHDLFPPIELTAAQFFDARGEFEDARAMALRAPTDRLCRETLCRLALDAGDTAQAEKHLAALVTLRGYGFAVRARLHERAVEQLITGEVARAQSTVAAGAGDVAAAARLRRVALEVLGAVLDDAVTYTFVPLALEVFTAAYALDPSLCEPSTLALAARHPASRYFVRRRASAMLPGALACVDESTLAEWLEVPPTELVPIVVNVAEQMRQRLVMASSRR